MAVAIVSGPPLCFGHSTQKSTVALVGAIVGLCRMYARGLTKIKKKGEMGPNSNRGQPEPAIQWAVRHVSFVCG